MRKLRKMKVGVKGAMGVLLLLLVVLGTTYPLVSLEEICPVCKGKGEIVRTEFVQEKCERCNGTGNITLVRCKPEKEETSVVMFETSNSILIFHGYISYKCKWEEYNKTCPVCKGRGKIFKKLNITQSCPLCNGTGSLKYKVPIFIYLGRKFSLFLSPNQFNQMYSLTSL